MESRDSFKSRLGFILVSAGCAIGIGNVWKFPYITGQYGGAVFVLFYLAFLVLMGIPVMTMELAVGRASGKSVLLGFRKLEKPLSTEQYGIGFKKGNEELRDAVQEKLFEMYEDGTFQKIAEKYAEYNIPEMICIERYMDGGDKSDKE